MVSRPHRITLAAALAATSAGCALLFDFDAYDPSSPLQTAPAGDAATTRDGALTRFDVEPRDVRVVTGARAVTIVRLERIGEPGVTPLDVLGLPPGVTVEASPLEIPAGALERQLVLVAAPDARTGVFEVTVRSRTAQPRSAVFTLRVQGTPGTLDKGFGQDGVALATGLAVVPSSVVVLPDRRVVVGASDAGRVVLVRFTPDGALDSTFGTAGILRTDAASTVARAAVAASPDGALVVASGAALTLVRADGVVSGGLAGAPGEELVFGQRDAEGGVLAVVNVGTDRAVVRHLDGELATRSEEPLVTGSLAVEANGVGPRAILVGTLRPNRGACGALVYVEGSPPSHREISGCSTLGSVGATADAGSVALLGVLGGRTDPAREGVLARWEGSASTYGLTFLGFLTGRAGAMAVDSSSRIALALLPDSKPFFARYLPDGSRDASFSGSGVALLSDFLPSAVAVGPDDAIVVAGGLQRDGGRQLAITRLWP